MYPRSRRGSCAASGGRCDRTEYVLFEGTRGCAMVAGTATDLCNAQGGAHLRDALMLPAASAGALRYGLEMDPALALYFGRGSPKAGALLCQRFLVVSFSSLPAQSLPNVLAHFQSSKHRVYHQVRDGRHGLPWVQSFGVQAGREFRGRSAMSICFEHVIVSDRPNGPLGCVSNADR
jgi:hypothetical protein